MTRLEGIRAAIVDLDGTMVDTAPDFLVAVNRMRSDLGLAPTDIGTITRFVGKGTENLMRRVLALDYDVAGVERHFEAALASYSRHYIEINGLHSSVYPGVREGLAALRAKGLRLACVTNKPYGFARPLLASTGLDGYFELVYGGDSLPKKKPDPYPLLKVCEDFGLTPAQVVAIGDSSNDALAARAAGCRVLNVPYGYNHGESIHNVDSDGIVSSLLDAANLIHA
ncbi:phosphoglycolate phosphatase [Noviherbaspirillum aridicola]|uniref:Phosphoglycolate phosphatase n=1 Tax=Noviherbaspirillum aridicola TaxID=2849687 RepID=A0ABQ4Q8Y2_9BURK|nr:phosphoglycolate phosphatase [Noviherbaspirillum aridicola]GIZ53514.1 phosphoglycolate phosphatase, bacterial [Noviherbaspirillum aridicola]